MMRALDFKIMSDIKWNNWQATSASELLMLVCDKWRIEDRQTIKQVYQAILTIHHSINPK
jgi:hypothetical protein